MSNRLLGEPGSVSHSLRPAAEADDGDKGQGAVQFSPEGQAEPEGCGEMVKAWPKTTLLIIGNEFCERFSYYGMRTILTIYMLSILKWDPNMTTSVFHIFVFLAYFTPILGSILADGYIGKFQTILWLSIVYAGGQVTLTVASTFKPDTPFFHPWLDIIGLLVIGLGTGGIKPCVSSFGGDQFDPSQLKLISMFFSAFYFAINAGSCISTILTPILRSVACLDNDSCFPLAFGVPAALMIVATVIFVAGSYWYKKKPPKENVIFLVIGTTFKGLWNRIRSGGVKRNHWVEHYLNTHSCASDPACLQLRNNNNKNKCHKAEFIEGLKGVYHVMVMFIPVPIFWALFDQTGSRWIIQAVAMNGRLWKGGLNIAPDQLQVANALLILVMIPLFQLVIYPLVKKFGIEPTPLRRMSVGGFIAALSFVVVGFIQLQVNSTLPKVPEHGHIHLIGINVMAECNVSVKTEKGDNDFLFSFSDDKKRGLKTSTYDKLDIGGASSTVKLELTYNGTGCPTTYEKTIETTFEERHTYYLVVGPRAAENNQFIAAQIQRSKLTKSRGGNGESTVNVNSFISVTDDFKGMRIAFCRFDEGYKRSHVCNPRQGDEFAYATFCLKPDEIKDIKNEQNECKQQGLASTFADLREGKYKVYSIKYGAPEKEEGSERTISAAAFDEYIDLENPIGNIEVEGQGAVVTHTFYNDTSGHAVDYTAAPNSISILWQIIPYAIITSSEILFSITGLEFSYSQAPRNMKAFMSAMWLLTVAMGNVIVFVVTEIEIFENLAFEMFFYAAFMAVVMLLFTAMSIFYYEYHYYTESDEDEVGDGATDNPAMVDEDEVIESKY